MADVSTSSPFLRDELLEISSEIEGLAMHGSRHTDAALNRFARWLTALNLRTESWGSPARSQRRAQLAGHDFQ